MFKYRGKPLIRLRFDYGLRFNWGNELDSTYGDYGWNFTFWVLVPHKVFIHTPSPPIVLIDLIYFRVFVCRNCCLKFVWFLVGVGLGTHGFRFGRRGWLGCEPCHACCSTSNCPTPSRHGWAQGTNGYFIDQQSITKLEGVRMQKDRRKGHHQAIKRKGTSWNTWLCKKWNPNNNYSIQNQNVGSYSCGGAWLSYSHETLAPTYNQLVGCWWGIVPASGIHWTSLGVVKKSLTLTMEEKE